MKRVYRLAALVMSLILALASPITSLAAVSSQDLEGATEDSQTWEVKIGNRYSQENVNISDNSRKWTTTSGNGTIQIDDKVFITLKEDGTYHIKMRYASFSIWDTVAVIDPEFEDNYFEAIRKTVDPDADDTSVGKLRKIKYATFLKKNKEKYIDPRCFEKTDRKGELVYDYESMFNENFDGFFLQNVTTYRSDEEMDWGILEFDVKNPDKLILIKAFSSVMAQSASVYQDSIILELDWEGKNTVPETYTYSPGPRLMGFEWTNFRKGYTYSGQKDASGSSTETFLDSLFENTVQVTVDKQGRLAAVFTLNKDAFDESKGKDQVTSISLITKRDPSLKKVVSDDKGSYNEGYSVTELESLDITGDSISISFDDLRDGKLLMVMTPACDALNKTNKDPRTGSIFCYTGRLWLTAEPKTAGEEVVRESQGVILTTDTISFQDDYQFIVEKTKDPIKNITEGTLDTIKAYAVNDESYDLYSFWIADKDGNRVVPKSKLTVDIPIPYKVNQTHFLYARRSEGVGQYGLPTGEAEIIERGGQSYLRITPKNFQKYDFDICIYDAGKPMDASELASLGKGKYYEVRPTLRNIGYNDRPSMSAPVIYGRKGILHVTENGEYELYVTLQGVNVGNYGYISSMYINTTSGDRNAVDILSYKSTADLRDEEWSEVLQRSPEKERSAEDLNIDVYTDQYQLHYLQTLRIPLGELDENNEWPLTFVVPLMNAFGGDIKTGVKDAGLRILSGSAVEVSSEECPDYNNTLLLGTIENAQWYLDTMESSDEKQVLSNAVQAAKESYQELQKAFDREKLIKAVDTLNDALSAAGGNQTGKRLSSGTYKIPFKIWNSYDSEHEKESIYREQFSEKADLIVRGNSMTVDLPVNENSAIENIRYYSDEQSENTDAEKLTDSAEKTVGFRIVRNYDEQDFRVDLTVGGKSYAVSVAIDLDFVNAVKVAASEEEIEALQTLITEVNKILSSDETVSIYTASSVSALKKAAEDAQTALDASDSLEYDTVMTQTERLTTAKNGLIEKTAIQSMLEQKLNETVSYMDREDSYTEESFTKLKEAVKTANSVLSSYAMTDEKIAEAEAAMDAIDAAIEGLKSKKLAELEAAIAEAETISGSSYTEASYQAFESALQKAKETAADSNAADEDYTQALTALNAAKEGLEQKTDPTPDPENPGTAEKELKELYQKQRSTLTKEDSYEETSFASWKTSMDEAAELLNDSRGYTVTEAQYEAAAAALKAEYQALILQSELDKDADAAIAAYASWAEEEEAVEETVVSVTASASNALRTASASNAARKVQTISLFALETAALTETQTQSEDEELDLMDLPDGTYRVDYCLWQFNADDYSMGNDALVDAYPEISGKQAKVTVSDGKVYLWLDFQKKTASGLTGRLLTMNIMTNIVKKGTTLESYTKVAPVQTTYTDETDQYLPAGQKYPQTMVFDVTDYVTAYKTQIPVFVNVPVMGASAEQPAYINLYYDTFAKADAGTDVPGGDDTEYSIDLEALQTAMKTASAVDGSKYTETSYTALEASYEAADRLLSYADDELATQTMADNRTAALTATRKALIPKAGTDVPEEPENPDTPSDPTTEDTSVAKAKLQELIKYAGTLNQMQYTDASWTSMNLSLVSARGVYAAKTATTAELTAAAAELTAAIKALVPASDNDGSGNDDSDTDNDPGSDGTSSKNGYYKVKVRLWHASMNKASMGDDAVVKTAYVHIEDGDVTMRLVTKEMETSGITAHLHDFYIYRDGDYQSATLAADTGEYWIYEFELPNSSSQFYKCKVDPQVDVMGDEPVKARLKVNWSGKKSIDSDDWDSVIDDPDDIISTSSKSSSSSGSGVTGSAELVDNETGAKLTGNIGAPGVKLEVKKIDQGGVYDSTKSTLADKNQFVLYDVKVTVNGEQVQPSESVKLRLPIPIGFDASRITAYRISEDGSARSEIAGTVNGSYYEFSVDHFSLFALSEVPAADTAVTTAQAADQTTAQAAAAGSAQAVPQAQTSGNGGSTGSSGYTSAGSAGSSSGNTGRSTTGTTGSGFSFSGNTGSGAGNTSNGTKDIPYTGDTTPVTAMAGIGAVALLIFFSTFVPKKKRKEN